MAGSSPSKPEGPRYFLYARDLERGWSETLIALILGLDLAEDLGDEENELLARAIDKVKALEQLSPPPPGHARVVKSNGNNFALVECATLDEFRNALARDGLEVPCTHGYKYCSVYPVAGTACTYATPLLYAESTPLEMQLAPLPTAELERRLAALETKASASTNTDARDAKRAKVDDTRSKDKKLFRPLKKPKCKTTYHLQLCSELSNRLGGCRPVRRCSGVALDTSICSAYDEELLSALREFKGWPKNKKKRKGVCSANYAVLKRSEIEKFVKQELTQVPYPVKWEFTAKPGSKQWVKEKDMASKVDIWTLAAMTLVTAVPEIGLDGFDALASTQNFRGSPHVDKHDVSHQYAIALGDFDGGELCVEDNESCAGESASHAGGSVVSVDVNNKIARIDGRHVHWVKGYTGERFSVVFFRTKQENATDIQPTAVHEKWMKEYHYGGKPTFR